MAQAFIGLGANLNDRAAALAGALAALDATPEITVLRTSDFIETAPIGWRPQTSSPVGGGATCSVAAPGCEKNCVPPGESGDQPPFLNAAAALETGLSPGELLARMLAIERQFGRVRTVKWGPRTLDLDLLLYDALIINEPDLIVPHPLMHTRLFVLAPLAQIAPHARHPLLNQTVAQMLAAANATENGKPQRHKGHTERIK